MEEGGFKPKMAKMQVVDSQDNELGVAAVDFAQFGTESANTINVGITKYALDPKAFIQVSLQGELIKELTAQLEPYWQVAWLGENQTASA